MKLGLRSKAELVVNSLKAKMNLGGYWYWLPETEIPAVIPIRPLVQPLRYDILVRKEFYDFYQRKRELFRSDPEGFVTATKGDHALWRNFCDR